MAKSVNFQVLLIECALVVSLVAIIGHSTFRIWERCVVQKELARMRSSLYMMKNTVNTISHAYDHLQRDLSQITKLSQEEIYRPPPSYLHSYTPQIPQITEVPQKISKFDMIMNTPSKKSTSAEANVSPHLADEMTMTRLPLKSTGTEKSVEKFEKFTDYSKAPSDVMSGTILRALDTSTESFYINPYNKSLYQNNTYDTSIKVLRAEHSSISEFDPFPKMLDKYYLKHYGSGDMTEDTYTSISNVNECPSESYIEEYIAEISNDDKVDTATSYTPRSFRNSVNPVRSNYQKHTPIAHFRNRKVQCCGDADAVMQMQNTPF